MYKKFKICKHCSDEYINSNPDIDLCQKCYNNTHPKIGHNIIKKCNDCYDKFLTFSHEHDLCLKCYRNIYMFYKQCISCGLFAPIHSEKNLKCLTCYNNNKYKNIIGKLKIAQAPK